MKKGVLVVAATVAALASSTGVVSAVAANANNAALEVSRDSAVAVVRDVTGNSGAEKYITYLNGLIEKADYCLQDLSTCGYSDVEISNLVAALDEGAKATTYLATSRQATGNTTAQATTTQTVVSSNAKNKIRPLKLVQRLPKRPQSLMKCQ